jgi:hypothetical protein
MDPQTQILMPKLAQGRLEVLFVDGKELRYKVQRTED